MNNAISAAWNFYLAHQALCQWVFVVLVSAMPDAEGRNAFYMWLYRVLHLFSGRIDSVIKASKGAPAVPKP